jgi:hypothetical protein
MIMEKKLRFIHVVARSNMDTRIQLTLSEETEDLRHLISMALLKISQFDNDSETYRIEHIDSIPHLYESDK